jgi:SAM-dependent methyltransferase
MLEGPTLPTSADAAETHPAYPIWDSIAPLPNERMMFHIGAPTVENFLLVGDAWGQLVARELEPESHVLDIGCGCGRTARTLLHHPNIVEYLGIDVIWPFIAWCERFLTPLTNGRFRFELLDVASAHYNPGGSTPPEQVRFPLADANITLAFAASLFTHLKEGAAARYLEETRRVLKPGGKLMTSIHVTASPENSYTGNETRIDVDASYFQAMARRADLHLERSLGDVCGQETFVFVAR